MEAKAACRPDKANESGLLGQSCAPPVRGRAELVVLGSCPLYDNPRWVGKHSLSRACSQCQLVRLPLGGYIGVDFGRAEDRFPRSSSGEEESPNTKGRDAA